MDKKESSVRIVIADDHTIFRDGLRRFWRPNPNWKWWAKPPTAPKRWRKPANTSPMFCCSTWPCRGWRAWTPCVSLPQRKRVNTKIIVLTAAVERMEIVQALQLGARGVVMKEAATQLLMKAIRTVMTGQYWIGREAIGDVVEFMRTNPCGEKPPRNFGLTKREMDILTTIVAGLSNKEIARKFSLSEDTVKHHLTNIFDKVGVASRLGTCTIRH